MFLAITDDAELYRLLGKQDRELIRRLHSGTPDRVRLLDVLQLQQTLGLDLMGIYDRAEGLRPSNELVATRPVHRDPFEARIVSLFVALCSWFRSLDKHGDRWLQSVRNDIASKQRALEQASEISGD